MKTQTNKSIKTKKAGLLLSTESVNTLKTADSWLDSVVWYGSGSTLHYPSINSKAHASNNTKFK